MSTAFLGAPHSAAVGRAGAHPLQGGPFQAPVESEGPHPVREQYMKMDFVLGG